jgi:hypothetical protein
VLFELDAEAFSTATVDSGHQSFHHPTRPKAEAGDAGENARIKVIFFAVGHATDSIFTTTV